MGLDDLLYLQCAGFLGKQPGRGGMVPLKPCGLNWSAWAEHLKGGEARDRRQAAGLRK